MGVTASPVCDAEPKSRLNRTYACLCLVVSICKTNDRMGRVKGEQWPTLEGKGSIKTNSTHIANLYQSHYIQETGSTNISANFKIRKRNKKDFRHSHFRQTLGRDPRDWCGKKSYLWSTLIKGPRISQDLSSVTALEWTVSRQWSVLPTMPTVGKENFFLYTFLLLWLGNRYKTD